jgi:hypothetical protein
VIDGYRNLTVVGIGRGCVKTLGISIDDKKGCVYRERGSNLPDISQTNLSDSNFDESRFCFHTASAGRRLYGVTRGPLNNRPGVVRRA